MSGAVGRQNAQEKSTLSEPQQELLIIQVKITPWLCLVSSVNITAKWGTPFKKKKKKVKLLKNSLDL